MRLPAIAPAIAIAALGILAAGCITVTADIAVNPDRSGSMLLVVEIDGDVLGAMAGTCDDLSSDIAPDAPDGITVEHTVEQDDGVCRLTTSIEWTDASADDAFALLAEDGGPDIAQDSDGGWSFRVEPLPDEDIEESFAAGQSVTFTVTLPGQAESHNAELVQHCDRAEFRWDDLSPLDGLAMTATTNGQDKCGGGGLSGTAVALIVASVIALGAAAYAVTSRRER